MPRRTKRALKHRRKNRTRRHKSRSHKSRRQRGGGWGGNM